MTPLQTTGDRLYEPAPAARPAPESTCPSDPDAASLPAIDAPAVEGGGDARASAGRRRRAWIGWMAAAAVGTAAFLATLASPAPARNETVHANWREHVEPLTAHNRAAGTRRVKHVGRGGQERLQSAMHVTAADEDPRTTSRVMAFLERGDRAGANKALQEAQAIPVLHDADGGELPRMEPSISDGMKDELMRGDSRFFHIFLYDSCDEDGDVVRILLNGQAFAVVPITNRGVTLSVPVGSGTMIALQGVRDGMGGITVACRTSQGDYFTSAMAEGEMQPISVVR